MAAFGSFLDDFGSRQRQVGSFWRPLGPFQLDFGAIVTYVGHLELIGRYFEAALALRWRLQRQELRQVCCPFSDGIG